MKFTTDNMPAISVIISTYSNIRYVEKKFDEILRQTAFQKAEFLFIETASPEKERNRIEPFCKRHKNCRLITFDDRKTLYECWNIGWQAATAPLVCYSNMDDYMHPALLEKVIDAFSQSSSIDVCTPLIAYQQEDEYRNSFDLSCMKKRRLSIRPGPFTAWRKDIYKKTGYFDPAFFSAGDKDFWARICKKKLRIKIIWKVLYLFTKSPTQLSKNPSPNHVKDKIRQKTKPYRPVWPLRYKLSIKILQPVWNYFPRLFLMRDSDFLASRQRDTSRSEK
ncbi:MAG: glycosyltransferase [Kiritimatiellales bacterium]